MVTSTLWNPGVLVTVALSQAARTPENPGAAARDAKVPDAAMKAPPSDEAAACGVSTTSAWLRPHTTIVRVVPASAWWAIGGQGTPGETGAVDTMASVTSHTQADAAR